MKGTILIVDDTEDTRLLFKKVLDLDGYTTIPVSDGVAAINFLTHLQPDLIITDLMMPEISGVDLIKYLRHHAPFMDTPIIVVSAFLSYLEEAGKAGASIMLRKPVDVIELPKIVSLLLSPKEATYH